MVFYKIDIDNNFLCRSAYLMKKNTSILVAKQEYCIYCKRPINKSETALQSHRECYYAIIDYQKKLKKLQDKNITHDLHNRCIHVFNSFLMMFIRLCYHPIHKIWLVSSSVTTWTEISYMYFLNFL